MNILYLFLGISFKKHDFIFHSYGVSFVLKSYLRNAWKCLAWWFSRKEMGLQSSPREKIQRYFLVFDGFFFPDFEFTSSIMRAATKLGKQGGKSGWCSHTPGWLIPHTCSGLGHFQLLQCHSLRCRAVQARAESGLCLRSSGTSCGSSLWSQMGFLSRA